MASHQDDFDDREHFRYGDLPKEIQDKIIDQYYDGRILDLQVFVQRFGSGDSREVRHCIHLVDNDRALMLVNKNIYQRAKTARARSRIILRSTCTADAFHTYWHALQDQISTYRPLLRNLVEVELHAPYAVYNEYNAGDSLCVPVMKDMAELSPDIQQIRFTFFPHDQKEPLLFRKVQVSELDGLMARGTGMIYMKPAEKGMQSISFREPEHSEETRVRVPEYLDEVGRDKVTIIFVSPSMLS